MQVSSGAPDKITFKFVDHALIVDNWGGFFSLRADVSNGENKNKKNSSHILRLGRSWCETNTIYFVSLNIDLFTRKSIRSELRQNAAFEAQTIQS